MIVRKEIIEQLSKELSLSFTGAEQDWDIELADKRRVVEFISFYKKYNLSIEKKYATMSLILASYDKFLNDKEIDRDNKWDKIKLILSSEKEIFNDLIEYWSAANEIEDVFRITPLIRGLRITN